MMKYNEKNFKENRPTADVLMSSMRSMGYREFFFVHFIE